MPIALKITGGFTMKDGTRVNESCVLPASKVAKLERLDLVVAADDGTGYVLRDGVDWLRIEAALTWRGQEVA